MRRHVPWIALSVLSLMLMPLLTSRGRVGGDELEVFRQLNHFYSTGLSLWEFLESKQYGWLAHRLYWFFQQYVVVSIAKSALTSIGIADTPFILQFAVSYSQALLAWAGLVVCGWYAVIRLKMPHSSACLLVAMFWFTGYGLCFLIGNYIENSMILLVACRLFLFQENKSGRKRPMAILALAIVDFLLFAAKPYSILFTTLTIPLALRGEHSKLRFLTIYAIGILTLIACWESLMFVARNGFGYESFPWSLSPPLIFERLFHALFSLTFGLAWTLPALWFLLATKPPHTQTLAVKLVALFGLQLFFSTLPFWHGGMAGGRYLFPFIIFLLPEIADGFKSIVNRAPIANLLVVIACFLTFPIIDYRNTNVSEYYNNSVFKGVAGDNELFKVDTYPLYDWSFHPVVFAWRVVIAKAYGDSEIKAAASVPVSVPIAAIYPMTGISRVAYLLEVRPPVGAAALNLVESTTMGSVAIWTSLRYAAVSLMLLGILLCAVEQMRVGQRNQQ